jgi:hypothetical protein
MFRFTIRDVLWLTVVVALLIAWHVSDLQRRQNRIKADNYERAYHTMKGHLVEQGRELSKARQLAAQNAATPNRP